MKFIRILLLLTLPAYFFSCKVQQPLPYYLDKVSDTTGKGAVKIPELRVQKGDLLSIQVYSLALDPKIDEMYNLPMGSATATGATTAATSAGFLVDNNGNIEHPKLGKFHAEGLTKHELAAEVRKRLTEPVELLKNPTVIIRYLNFRVTVLGQVAKEGPVTVPGERLTILEAVGLAGGITDYGKKDDIKVMREINGQRETGVVNLASNDFFESPFYNLMQNDVVIVSPTKQRLKQEEQQRQFQKVSIGLTLVAAAATIANIFIRN